MIVILFASAGVALHYWHWDHQLKTAFAIFFILLILTSSCGVQCAGQHHKFQYANTFGLNFFLSIFALRVWWSLRIALHHLPLHYILFLLSDNENDNLELPHHIKQNKNNDHHHHLRQSISIVSIRIQLPGSACARSRPTRNSKWKWNEHFNYAKKEWIASQNDAWT